MISPGTDFDVIFLGDGLSGLIAASLLAKEGRKIVLLKERRYRPYYEREGYRFVFFSTPLDETIPIDLLRKIPFPEQGPGYREAGAGLKRSVAFQVLLPEARIDLYRDRTLLRKEWQREFPKELGPIEAFYEALERRRQDPFPFAPPSFFNRAFPLDRFLRARRVDDCLPPLSKEFETVLQLQALSRSYLYLDSYPLPLLARLIEYGETGPRVQVDLGRVERGLLHTLLHNGGLIQETDEVERVEVRWRGEVRVYLKEGRGPLQCQRFVINTPPHSFSNLFGKKRDFLFKWRGRIRPRYKVIPFCAGIRKRVVPVGMGGQLVSLLDPEKPLEGGNLLFLRLGRLGEEASAPEGKIGLTAEALMPFDESGRRPISELETGVIAHLNRLFPFLEDSLEFIDRRWIEEQGDCWSYPHYIYGKPSHFRWWEGIVPIKISRSVYVSGRVNYPQLGMEGEFLSGIHVAEELSKSFR
ncbi:MAG: hypothetical protein N3G78_01060 [Desulfobacterota bacterium]|nr:hypothetical protein [Thermodesulfobacteriota bacterium]